MAGRAGAVNRRGVREEAVLTPPSPRAGDQPFGRGGGAATATRASRADSTLLKKSAHFQGLHFCIMKIPFLSDSDRA